MPPLKPMEGKIFGLLTVSNFICTDKYRDRIFLCKCSCGGESKVAGRQLRSGRTRSCGCLKIETSKTNNRKHGLCYEGGKYSRLYTIWIGMKKRCHNVNSKSYKDYGGRGIKLCDSWENDYSSFHDWATTHGYSYSLTIERKDNNGNYEPSNCTWIPRKQNGRNQRTTLLTMAKANRIREFHWAKIPRSELAQCFGVSIPCISAVISGRTWV
jgi:hypothetical protein